VPKGNLSEWKLSVCTDLVKAVVPTDPDDALSWEDLAVCSVFEYKRDRTKWQNGDPNFDLYRDNFIRKEYILNRRSEIREKLIQEEGIVLLWQPGRGSTGVWRDDTEDALLQYLGRRRTVMQGQIDGYNEDAEAGVKHHPALAKEVVRFDDKPRLLSAVGN
jgi:hypothetical protein